MAEPTTLTDRDGTGTAPALAPAPAPTAARPPTRRRRRPSAIRLVLRVIAVTYVLALVALPVATVVRYTFADGLVPVLEVLTSPDFVAAARLTLVVAGLAVVVNTVFGVGVGILLARYEFPGRRLLNAVIDLPVSISPIVVGVALILVYGTNGWFGPALEQAGFQVIFAVPGMVLATVIVSLPLVVREVVPTLEEAGVEQEQAAQSLGAGGWARLWRITLPTIKWALAYGVVLSLARSLGEFGAVRVVSGSVAGQSQTLTLFVNDAYQEFGPDAQRAAFAAAFVLMLVAVLFIVVITALRPKEKR
ncbi:sulfate ABC transporter permease subunit CysW [Cellulomonas algicola]|uniref:Sulfate ABC transporter permease subunit CysW n=1 Tax=Cellulomonas algicola TaxID=2071633 RepID=A0A401UUW4_9CELL|nr:sulfate ABC transporter permease subunit [Cellulomonas algicola]GCD18476.1 sulfate ABC transporter permease subunit CysW [Cellulomonas algicola]